MDQRHTPRVQCFLLDDVRQQVPVWVFRPEDERGSIVAVAVDVSESGMAVLVDPLATIGPEHDVIHVLEAPEIGFPGARIPVRFRWRSQDGGLFNRAGFDFEVAGREIGKRLTRLIEHRPETGHAIWLRCTLLESGK